MPRYFLHIIRDDFTVEDIEGSEFPDLDAARKEAIQGARGILSEEVLSGSLSLDERIDITDAAGMVLASVPFLASIEIRMPNRDSGTKPTGRAA